MPQTKMSDINDVRGLQFEMAEGTRRARYVKEPDVKKYLADKEKKKKDYIREDTSDPNVRAWQRSYYRGDQAQKPLDPDLSNPGDKELRDLYEGSGKYKGFGKTALGGTQSNSVSKDDRYRRGMNIKK